MKDGDITAAAQALAQGRLIAFPTETVYGLGARADDDAAVARIFAAKGRPTDHPLIVHVADAAQAHYFAASLSTEAQRLMAAFWPGPLTLIVPRRREVGAAAAGGQDSIGLRLPAHPLAQALLLAARDLGVPGVAAPSANRFGRISPTTAAHVRQEFGAQVRVLDGGPCAVGIESAIVDCRGDRPTLLRPGQLSRARIEQALGGPLAAAGADAPRASGTLESHYAPAAPVTLWDADALRRAVRAPPAGLAGAAIGVYSRLGKRAATAAAPGHRWLWRTMPDAAERAAHELFSALRELDAAAVAAIWVERPPPDAEWDGVRDRLQRAAAA
jgi:L-threonylcarbamoyladenylate synthase